MRVRTVPADIVSCIAQLERERSVHRGTVWENIVGMLLWLASAAPCVGAVVWRDWPVWFAVTLMLLSALACCAAAEASFTVRFWRRVRLLRDLVDPTRSFRGESGAVLVSPQVLPIPTTDAVQIAFNFVGSR